MTAPALVADATGPRRGRMALVLQELITAGARIASRETDLPSDAAAFRASVKHQISAATQAGRQAGYREEDVGYGIFAVVAFLDETILALQLPAFGGWVGQPLSLDLFGANVGGESFFQYLEALLRRDDSGDLSDVLEVFLLCLQLGFRGKYGDARSGELHGWATRVGDRIARIRGAPGPFAPHWAPPGDERPQRSIDLWQRRLLIGALSTTGIVVALWVVFRFVLNAGVRAVA